MPLKLDVFFAFFSYGGNSSVAGQHPLIRRWFAETVLEMRQDPRVGAMIQVDYSDTPIPMMRNRAVAAAQAAQADLLVMLDSDNVPDVEPGGKPFWDTSFDFAYRHWAKGPVAVAAPYTGPPPHENIFVFRWANFETGNPDPDLRLEQYGREEAAHMAGIHPAAAAATGLILFDMRLFGLYPGPYFYYEYEEEGQACPQCGRRRPGPQTHKASTEDVTMTRDLNLLAREMLGYNPVHCNWDSWAGHAKVKITGKPRVITTDQIGEIYKETIRRNLSSQEKLVFVRPAPAFPGIQYDPPVFQGDGHAIHQGQEPENDPPEHSQAH